MDAFDVEVDEIFSFIEERLEEQLADDVDLDNNVILTISAEAPFAPLIFSRQVARSEIWLACKKGGFHFSKQKHLTAQHLNSEHFTQQWIDSKGNKLFDVLNDVLLNQLGKTISFN